MNQKEVSELRRRWRTDKNSAVHIYGCFVNGGGQIVSELDEPVALMPQQEAETYFGLLKKSLSGQLGKNLIDIVFSTRQVMDSGEHRLLSSLRSGNLRDLDARREFYRRVTECLDMDGSSYLLLMACDSYDVPRRGQDGEVQPDASEEVFTYILCCVCPVKDVKVELGYFPGDNEFHCVSGQVVSAPELGFLFPAFDGRRANIYNALYYSRSSEMLHQEFIDAIFHTEPPMSAAEQKEAFQSAVSDALEGACSMEVMQAVHEQIGTKIAQHRESRDPEPLSMTAGEICGILQDCGVPAAKAENFRKRCGEQFGDGAMLNPANIIDTGRFELKTSLAKVSISPENSYIVETRVIDGRKYILIPAEENVEVNGMSVRIAGE